MPNLLLLLQLLIISRLFVCNTSSQVKTWEVLNTSTIHVTDGRPHYFDLTSGFIDKNRVVNIESLDKRAQFMVTLMDTHLKHCIENISVKIPYPSSYLSFFCDGKKRGRPYTLRVPGQQFSINFTDAKSQHAKLDFVRFFQTREGHVCQNKTDHQCDNRCFWEDVKCDERIQCRDGSDERNCPSNSTYTFRPAYRTNSTDQRHCDLSGAALYDPPEGRHKKAWTWYVVAYSTGIIISTVICSLVAGFCFMPPYLNDDDELELEQRRRDAGQDGERRLDPLLDHPPSYEDVMNMDLSATPHRDAVPKKQTLDSPS